MTETEWLGCDDPTPMLSFVRGKVSERKLSLFACSCCRLVWRSIRGPVLRNAVYTAELFADGMADEHELKAARDAICPGPYFIGSLGSAAAAAFGAVTRNGPPVWSVEAAADLACTEAMRQALDRGRTNVPLTTKAVARQSQASLLRDVVGNPFRGLPIVNASWLTHDGGAVPKVAMAIYDGRAFDRLAALADALEAAGCRDPELLGHLRSTGPHVRGCWAVDHLLGRG